MCSTLKWRCGIPNKFFVSGITKWFTCFKVAFISFACDLTTFLVFCCESKVRIFDRRVIKASKISLLAFLFFVTKLCLCKLFSRIFKTKSSFGCVSVYLLHWFISSKFNYITLSICRHNYHDRREALPHERRRKNTENIPTELTTKNFNIHISCLFSQVGRI